MGRNRWSESMEDVSKSWQSTRAEFASYKQPSKMCIWDAWHDSIPKPRKAPTFPLTCSAHRCASSFCLISFARASACLTAALAVEKTLPHHPPPELCAWAASETVDFSDSISPSPLLAGVKLLWNDRELSPDLRKCAFSSLDRAPSVDVGVPVLVTLGDDFAVDVVCIRGVWGLLDALGLSDMPNSSKSASGS